MGKGDRRSKRGKIFRGTYGKKRPKPQEERKRAKAAAAATRSRKRQTASMVAAGRSGSTLRSRWPESDFD